MVGWVRRRRDLGSLVFVDLRDRSGLLQLVFEDEMVAEGEKLGAEDVVRVCGAVRERAEGQANEELASGAIEVRVDELDILNAAETPPFVIEDRANASEELRLTHRYLDLRRPEMTSNLVLRHKVVAETRRFFDEMDFIEVETPILTRSTPEGRARLPGAVAAPQGFVLRAAPVASALQTAPSGRGDGPVCADHPLFPGRRPEGGPATGVHPGRC